VLHKYHQIFYINYKYKLTTENEVSNQNELLLSYTNNQHIPENFKYIVDENPTLYNDMSVQIQRLKYLLDDSDADDYFWKVMTWQYTYVTSKNVIDRDDKIIDQWLDIPVPMISTDLKQVEYLQNIVNLWNDQGNVDIISMNKFQNDIQDSAEVVFNKMASQNHIDKFY
jgi:hypothetical protein